MVSVVVASSVDLLIRCTRILPVFASTLSPHRPPMQKHACHTAAGSVSSRIASDMFEIRFGEIEIITRDIPTLIGMEYRTVPVAQKSCVVTVVDGHQRNSTNDRHRVIGEIHPSAVKETPNIWQHRHVKTCILGQRPKDPLVL